MLFQVFFLTRWINTHEERKEQAAWTPFRKLLLNSVVEHADALVEISIFYKSEIDLVLDRIKKQKKLTCEDKYLIDDLLLKTLNEVEKSRERFFFAVQTVAPCMQPYASGYCEQLFVFSNYFMRNLKKARNELLAIEDDRISDNEHTSQPLNGVWAYSGTIDMVRVYGFSGFKKNFVDSVWKTEQLHYHEAENEFLTRDEYSRALDSDKSKIELDAIPRTTPIKSFFDMNEEN